MTTVEVLGLSRDGILALLRGFEPAWANRICEGYLVEALAALRVEHEDRLISAADLVSRHVNKTYCKPNFKIDAPFLTCYVADGSLCFSIPISITEFVSINVTLGSVLVRWPRPAAMEVGAMLSALVYGAGVKGVCILEDKYRMSLRAGLVVATLGAECPLPLIDLLQETGVCEDFVWPPSSRAVGLMKRNK